MPTKRSAAVKVNPAPSFVPGATTLYAQLASVLRSRLIAGEWKPQQDFPSINELAGCYGLGEITVRRTLKMLSDEGLVSTHRGRRTVVAYTPPAENSHPLFSSVTMIENEVKNFGIRVLGRTRTRQLPDRFAHAGQIKGPFVRIHKLDQQGDKPYGVSVVYIPEDLYKRFPKGAENRTKLARLVVLYSPSPVTKGHECVTVEAADVEEAGLLSYPISAPVVRVERIFTDHDGRVVFCALTVYRGDRFSMTRDLSAYLKL